MKKIKAILFDMDGVLIDAKEWHYIALNKSLAFFGMEISPYDHIKTFDGLPTKKKLEILTIERGLPKELHNFINEIKQKNTMDEVILKCKPNFQHEYALSRLKAEGYILCVCSNSIKKTISTMLDKARIYEYFDLIISAEDVLNAKPDPEIYINTMEKLNIDPSEAIIIEDGEYGIKAALSSRAHLLVVKNVNEVNYFNIINKILSINKGME
jgi:beta-phosphoglucomutase